MGSSRADNARMSDVKQRLTPEQQERLSARIVEGVSYREIGRMFGICASAVARWAIKHDLRQTHRMSMAIDPRTRADKAPKPPSAHRKRAQVLPAIQAPPPPPPRPAPPQRPAKPAPAPVLTREDEQRMIEEAIAAGKGRRYELRGDPGFRQINTAEEAVDWLEAHGCEVAMRQKSGRSLIYYRATRDGRRLLVRPWYPAHELVKLARQTAASDGARVIAIRDAIAERNATSSKEPVNPGLIQYYDAPSRVPAYAART